MKLRVYFTSRIQISPWSQTINNVERYWILFIWQYELKGKAKYYICEILNQNGWNPITHIIGYCLYLDKQNICHKSSRWGWTKQWIQIQFKYICCFFKRRKRVALLKYFRTVVKWNLSVLPIFKLPCIEKNHKKKNANPFFIFNGLFSETRIISLIFRKQSERKLNIFIQCIILLMGSNAFAECSRGFANPENRKWKDGNDIKGGLWKGLGILSANGSVLRSSKKPPS